jgi:hypothetical protein
MSDVFYGLFQQHERMDRIAISMAIRGPLSLVGLAAGVWYTGSVVWAAAGSALASALVLAGYDIVGGWRLLNDDASAAAGQLVEALHDPSWRAAAGAAAACLGRDQFHRDRLAAQLEEILTTAAPPEVARVEIARRIGLSLVTTRFRCSVRTTNLTGHRPGPACMFPQMWP